MVVSIERVDFLRDRKTRRWLNSNVYKVCLFRLLFEREKETRDLSEKNRINTKLKHLQKKIDHLAERGELLGLNKEQIKRINMEIVEKTKRGENPKVIIQQLEEKSQK